MTEFATLGLLPAWKMKTHYPATAVYVLRAFFLALPVRSADTRECPSIGPQPSPALPAFSSPPATAVRQS